MPPTLVHAALGALLAAALLEEAYSRRGLAVVTLAAAVPDLDAPLSVVVPAAHGAVLHTLLVPLALALAVRWDVRREGSWLRGRYGSAGVRVAWVAVLAYALAGTGLDLLNLGAANPVWPLDTMFYSVVGKVEFTTTEGFVQTFYTYAPDGKYTHYVGQRGRPPAFCNPSAWAPRCGGDGSGAERVSPIFQGGWQVLVVLASVVMVAGRDWLARRAPGRGGER